MKIVTFLSVMLMLVAFTYESPLNAQVNALAYAKSPDHPSTWVVGATNIHQGLRWDASRQMLLADVTYSTADWADSVHPAKKGDYVLSFPTVRFDPSSDTFSASGIKVATLQHGLFGSHVVLDQKVELDVHRHHGRIYASLGPIESD